MPDDIRAKRPNLDRLRRQVMSLQEAAATARYIEQLEAAIELPPSQPSPQAMEMACQRELQTQKERAEKAEAELDRLKHGRKRVPWLTPGGILLAWQTVPTERETPR